MADQNDVLHVGVVEFAHQPVGIVAKRPRRVRAGAIARTVEGQAAQVRRQRLHDRIPIRPGTGLAVQEHDGQVTVSAIS